MNKLANMRHWSERMSPSFNMSRPNPGMQAGLPPHHKMVPQGAPPMGVPPAADIPILYAFNVPFSSDLAGPNTEDILHATADAVLRWTHPEDAPDDVPVHELPVHAHNLANLRALCAALPLDARVFTTVDTRGVHAATPKHARKQVTTVSLSGPADVVHKSRKEIFSSTPLSLRCTTIDVEGRLVCDLDANILRKGVTDVLDSVSLYCGVDIFLLGPKLTPLVDGLSGDTEVRRDQRWRVAIYGDFLSSEHAKTRILIHIDQLLRRVTDSAPVDASIHQLICGRNRKIVKHIESATNTAIYFPPPFASAFQYCPPGAMVREPAQIWLTGEKPEWITLAKMKLHEVLTTMRLISKDLHMSPAKIDSILLGRMDKIRRIIDTNGVYILFPPLGSNQGVVRLQYAEGVHPERVVHDLMSLAGQFYEASWFAPNPDARAGLVNGAFGFPSVEEIRLVMADICANSDADVSFDNKFFYFTGSDESVKSALELMSDIKFVTQIPHQIRVKIELANEHKEFVSGKKNGKINKIMGQSNVQIMFDSFGEYNFNIDVHANNYEHMKHGLGLVEQEMPASISFHVPDQYHKRIIGIGGQHIQRIMKKHSVFVKFSNAMERGGMGREDDESRVDNVICRTPARNAQNLELVKSEILEMVDRVDSEFTSQVVNVDRLYHRDLLARLPEIECLEKKWNCKIVFPSTEQASDEVTVTGPQWQVPKCVDNFLEMVPDKHEQFLTRSPELMEFLKSADFEQTIKSKLRTQYEVRIEVDEMSNEKTEDGEPTVVLVWKFTRNNAGGLRDAIEFLQGQFATAGLEPVVVKGSIPRPKSDTFEESLQFFDSKLLQRAPSAVATDSPTKLAFGDEVARERGIFDRLRKPGSMTSLTSFLDRRKNSSHSATPSSFFKGSSNVSKSSLISIDSTRSFNADRNPWNDSGVNLPEDDNPWGARVFVPSGSIPSNGADHKLTVPQPGDITPRHNTRQSADSGRPSTSHSTNSGYPGLMFGPPR